MATSESDSSVSSRIGLRFPSFLRLRDNLSTTLPIEMPQLDTTSRTSSSGSSGSSSSSESSSSRTNSSQDDSTEVPWYEKRQEDVPPPPPPPEEGSSNYSNDSSLPVISLRTEKSSFSGLTDTDHDATITTPTAESKTRLDSLHEEVEELKAQTSNGNENDLSKEELLACLKRLNQIQKELNKHDGNGKDNNNDDDDDKSATMRQSNRSSSIVYETPKTTIRKTIFTKLSPKTSSSPKNIAAKSAPTPKAKNKFQPTMHDRAAKSLPSAKGGRNKKVFPPVKQAYPVSPPPTTRPSWNNIEEDNKTPLQSNTKKNRKNVVQPSPAAKRKADIQSMKQRRSQMHLSQPNYSSKRSLQSPYHASPRQQTAARRSVRVPRTAPAADIRRTYHPRPSATTATATPQPKQKRVSRSASPGLYRAPGRMARRDSPAMQQTQKEQRPASAPATTKKRVSKGNKTKVPPMAPNLNDNEKETKRPSFIPHACNIEIPKEESFSEKKKRTLKQSPIAKRKTASIVYTDAAGRTFSLTPEQLQGGNDDDDDNNSTTRRSRSAEAIPHRTSKEKKAAKKKSKSKKNRAKSEEPRAVQQARIERAKKRREHDFPRSIRNIHSPASSTTSPPTATAVTRLNKKQQSPQKDNAFAPINDDLPIGESTTRSSFQLGSKEYEYATPPREKIITWNLLVIMLVLDLVIAVIAFSAFSGAKRECCGESFQRGALPWVTAALFFFLVLVEVILLNRAIFVTLSPRSVRENDDEEKQNRKRNDPSAVSVSGASTTASDDDHVSSKFCCLSGSSPNSLISIVNFLTVINPYFGFLIAWVLMYQAEKGSSIAVICLVTITILLHLMSLYLQRTVRKWWVKLIHASILLPFLCTIVMVGWYGQQDGICYNVDGESFWHTGCEVCGNGSPPVNGNLCAESIFTNGDFQTIYTAFDLEALSQADSCTVARRACFIPY